VSYFIASLDRTDEKGYPLFKSQEGDGWSDIKFATAYDEDMSKLYELPYRSVWCTSEDVRYLADNTRGQS